MDWLVSCQDDIERQLARRHLREGGMAMFDLSFLLGGRQLLRAGRPRVFPGRQARQGADRVRAAHRPQGRPVAVRVFAGNTGTPKTFPEAVDAVRGSFGLEQMIMVGDRGMITSARITELRKLEGMAWITCLRGPAIKKLMADGGPLQLSLSDEQDLAEISTPDYPGERRSPAATRSWRRARPQARGPADLDRG